GLCKIWPTGRRNDRLCKRCQHCRFRKSSRCYDRSGSSITNLTFIWPIPGSLSHSSLFTLPLFTFHSPTLHFSLHHCSLFTPPLFTFHFLPLFTFHFLPLFTVHFSLLFSLSLFPCLLSHYL